MESESSCTKCDGSGIISSKQCECYNGVDRDGEVHQPCGGSGYIVTEYCTCELGTKLARDDCYYNYNYLQR